MTKQEVALREATQSAVAQFEDPDFQQAIRDALPEGVSDRQFIRIVKTAILERPQLVKPELRAALLRSTLKAAADGLMPNGAEAALIDFGGKEPTVVYMPMIGGIRKVGAEHGWDIRGDIIRAEDTFEDRSSEGQVLHQKPRPGVDRGEIEGAWAMAVHRDGRRKAKVMSVTQIEKVRSTSKAAQRGPWVDWWEEMALKTVARRLFKELPLDPNDKRLARVIAVDESDVSAIDALYGPAARVIEHRPAQGSSSPPAAADQAGEDIGPGGAEQASPADDSPGFVEGEEPSDEDLDAMAEASEQAVEGEVVEEPRFPSGKYEGETVREVYESGGRGKAYVQWAATGWPNEDFRGEIAEALVVLEGNDG